MLAPFLGGLCVEHPELHMGMAQNKVSFSACLSRGMIRRYDSGYDSDIFIYLIFVERKRIGDEKESDIFIYLIFILVVLESQTG